MSINFIFLKVQKDQLHDIAKKGSLVSQFTTYFINVFCLKKIYLNLCDIEIRLSAIRYLGVEQMWTAKVIETRTLRKWRSGQPRLCIS